MNIKQIRKLAKRHGIATLQKKSPELIREIQRADRNNKRNLYHAPLLSKID